MTEETIKVEDKSEQDWLREPIARGEGDWGSQTFVETKETLTIQDTKEQTGTLYREGNKDKDDSNGPVNHWRIDRRTGGLVGSERMSLIEKFCNYNSKFSPIQFFFFNFVTILVL